MGKLAQIFAPSRLGLDGGFAGALVGCTILIIVANVAARFFSFAALVWSLELVEQIFPWIVFLGAAAAFRMRRELVVDSLFIFLPERGRIALLLFAHLVTMIVATTIAVIGIGLAIKLAPQHTMLLDISLSWRVAALPVGMGLIAVFSAMRLFHFVGSSKARAEEISTLHVGGE